MWLTAASRYDEVPISRNRSTDQGSGNDVADVPCYYESPDATGPLDNMVEGVGMSAVCIRRTDSLLKQTVAFDRSAKDVIS